MDLRIAAVFSFWVTTALGQVVLTVVDGPEPGNSYRIGSEYTLHCQGSLGSGCSITWFRGDAIMDETDQRIRIIAEPGSSTYTCNFLCNSGQNVDESNDIVVTGQNLIRVQVLNTGVSGDEWKPLENSNMELTCSFETLSSEFVKEIDESGSPSFIWMEDGQVKGNVQQETYSFVAIPGYSKSVQCQVVKDGEELMSAAVSIQATDEADEPEVALMRHGQMVDQGPIVTGVDYTAVCMSKSHSVDATYVWTRDYFVIPNTPTTRVFQIDAANADDDDGVYRCRMKLRSQEVCSRSAVPMQVQAAGRYCESETDCLLGDAYTQNCRNNRCECASGYNVRGDVCAGTTQLLASCILVTCAIVFSILF